jgi:polynucleotide 5'-hydroxyl-kinase GRC3/NOL9
LTLTVGKGKTLLVDGPAKIKLHSGKASVLGAMVKTGEQIVVRRGKRMPLEGLVGCEVELILGDSASYTMNEESTIPSLWLQATEKTLSRKEPTTVLVIGGIDCGKTGFCTYLANTALGKKSNIALIDGDLGQSDIGPPGTVSLCTFNEPVVDLFQLRSEDLKFIGATSPSGRTEAVLETLCTLKQRALEQSADFIIVNTDGWVEGDAAVKYKVNLVEKIAPDIVVAVQCENELSPILNALNNFQVIGVQSPQIIKKRDQETRKLLRESAYKKYLKELKVRSFPLSWIAVEGDLRFDCNKDSTLRKQIESLIEKEILFCQEELDYIIIMAGKKVSIEEEHIKKLESELGKRVLWLRRGDEEGLLVALEDANGKVLGLGIIGNMDFEKGVIALNTFVEEPVSKVRVGQIRLDAEGHEIGLIFENSNSR